jgi:5-formyltetrahydrofolate cyclo-ligase
MTEKGQRAAGSQWRRKIPIDRLLTRRERLRQRIWLTMRDAGVLSFPLDAFGRIPNFIGAEQAAELLAEQLEFESAQCIFVAPDHVLRRVRELVLQRGKVLAVALPLRWQRKGQAWLLQITERRAIKAAASVDNFLRYGQPLATPIDLVVLGSVVVDRQGHRLSPHRGLGDPELQRLRESGWLKDDALLATIAHPLQFADDLAKWVTDADEPVHLIVTPNEVVRPHLSGDRNDRLAAID